MRNSKTHSVTKKKKLNKCKKIFYAYNEVQFKYGQVLDENEDVIEIFCNVKLEDYENYTTDFLCIKKNGSKMIRECLFKEKLTKPMMLKMLDISRNYWLSRGIEDWGIVLNE